MQSCVISTSDSNKGEKIMQPFMRLHYLMELGPNTKKIPQNSGKQIKFLFRPILSKKIGKTFEKSAKNFLLKIGRNENFIK